MLKKLLFLTLVFTPFTLLCQIVDSNTIWSLPSSKYYYLENDTTDINGQKYYYIHKYIYDSTFHYNNAFEDILIKQENNKVYWRNIQANKDELIYDFSLSVNDSVYVTPCSGTWDSVLLVCEDIDTVNYFGIDRRRLAMRTVTPSAYFNTDIEYWIWGIGSTLGVLNPGRLHEIIFDTEDPILLCCHKHFDQVFDNPDYDKCYIQGVSIIESNINKINIYPNPANNQLIVQWPEQPPEAYSINIKDIQGRSVFQSTSGKETFIWNTSNVTEGIYVLHLYDAKGHFIYSQKISILH